MSLNRRHWLESVAAGSLLSALGQGAWAQAQVDAIKIVTGFPPGGTSDSLLGRIGATTKLWDGSWESGLFIGRLWEDRGYRQLLEASIRHLEALRSEDVRFIVLDPSLLAALSEKTTPARAARPVSAAPSTGMVICLFMRRSTRGIRSEARLCQRSWKRASSRASRMRCATAASRRWVSWRSSLDRWMRLTA